MQKKIVVVEEDVQEWEEKNNKWIRRIKLEHKDFKGEVAAKVLSKEDGSFGVLVEDIDFGTCENLDEARWYAELRAGEMLVRDLCDNLTTRK